VVFSTAGVIEAGGWKSVKLYWRVTINGKRTWVAANVVDECEIDGDLHVCIRGLPK
jgi:hypothetical protein